MKSDEFAPDLDRLDALLKWWGAPGAGCAELRHANLERFDAIVSELEQAVAEITANQEEALTQSRELLVQSLPVFVNSQDMNEVMAAQSKILLSLFDAASTQIKTWVTFADRVRNAQLALAAESASQDPGAGKTKPAEAGNDALPLHRNAANS